MEIERLKMWVRGKAIAGAAALSIREEMSSGPEEVLQGRFEMRVMMSLSVQRNSLGQEWGRGGGMGERGGAAELKHELKKELRQ